MTITPEFIQAVGEAEEAMNAEVRREREARKAEAERAAREPDAWVYELAGARYPDGEWTNWGPRQLSFYRPQVPEGAIRGLRPLFAGEEVEP